MFDASSVAVWKTGSNRLGTTDGLLVMSDEKTRLSGVAANRKNGAAKGQREMWANYLTTIYLTTIYLTTAIHFLICGWPF